MLAAAALAAAAGGGCADLGERDPAPPTSARVLRVVDGDTIRVRMPGGAEERVRYIGVDTPERGTCMYARATAANAKLVRGRRVRLVLDVEERDRYGRLLAYVYAGDRQVNAELVRGGYAQPLTVAPNVRFAARFGRLASRARASGRGLWRSCANAGVS